MISLFCKSTRRVVRFWAFCIGREGEEDNHILECWQASVTSCRGHLSIFRWESSWNRVISRCHKLLQWINLIGRTGHRAVSLWSSKAWIALGKSRSNSRVDLRSESRKDLGNQVALAGAGPDGRGAPRSRARTKPWAGGCGSLSYGNSSTWLLEAGKRSIPSRNSFHGDFTGLLRSCLGITVHTGGVVNSDQCCGRNWVTWQIYPTEHKTELFSRSVDKITSSGINEGVGAGELVAVSLLVPWDVSFLLIVCHFVFLNCQLRYEDGVDANNLQSCKLGQQRDQGLCWLGSRKSFFRQQLQRLQH